MLKLEQCLCKNSQAHLTRCRSAVCGPGRFDTRAASTHLRRRWGWLSRPQAPSTPAEQSRLPLRPPGEAERVTPPRPSAGNFQPPVAYSSLAPPPACAPTDPWRAQVIPHSPQHEGALGGSGGPEGQSQLRPPGEHHGGLGQPEQIAKWSSWWRIWVQAWGVFKAGGLAWCSARA